MLLGATTVPLPADYAKPPLEQRTCRMMSVFPRNLPAFPHGFKPGTQPGLSRKPCPCYWKKGVCSQVLQGLPNAYQLGLARTCLGPDHGGRP